MKKIIFILMFLICISISLAWMPDSHTYINENAMVVSNSEIAQLIKTYEDDFHGCDILTDLSVFYYFEEGFSAIGTKYKQTHTQALCKKMVENARTDQQLACAYGVCAHHVQDGVSHNVFVPRAIRKSKLVNGLIHVFAEEKVNDALKTNQLNSRMKSALNYVAPIHKEFFRENLVPDNSDFPFDDMYDEFVDEVTEQDKYSVGFRGFTAVPFEIHMILIIIFVFSLLGLGVLIKKSNKSLINYITIALILLIIMMPITGAYILFYTGKLWVFFQYASYPISQLMPTSGWEKDISDATQETINLLNKGSDYVIGFTPDPSGEAELIQASETGSTARMVFNIIVLIILGIIIYANFFMGRKKKRSSQSR